MTVGVLAARLRARPAVHGPLARLWALTLREGTQ